MGFRAFFFLYFTKYRIYSLNSPNPTPNPFPDILLPRREARDCMSLWGWSTISLANIFMP